MSVWKFAGKKEKIFIHNTVHNQILVLGQLIRFIINQLIGADQKGVSFFQAEIFPRAL